MPVASVLYTTLPMEIWYCTVVYMKMKKPKATQKETINKYSSSYLVGKGCPSMLKSCSHICKFAALSLTLADS